MTLGLFNLRGSDIEYNPVFFSYSIVTMDDARYLMPIVIILSLLVIMLIYY